MDFPSAQNLIAHILSWIPIYDKNFKLIAQMVLEIMCTKGNPRLWPGGQIGFLIGPKFDSAHPLMATNPRHKFQVDC